MLTPHRLLALLALAALAVGGAWMASRWLGPSSSGPSVALAAETAESPRAAERPVAMLAPEAVGEPVETTREAEGIVGDIQDDELVAEAAKAASTITPPGVKDIMADFGVPRLSTIAQEKRGEFIEKLHAAVKARLEQNKKDDNDIPL